MSQPPLKGAALLQDMAEAANPLQAEEERAKVFMEHLPSVQAASRRLQGQLEIHADEVWPLPLLPDDHNPFILEKNARKIRSALENCKKFAVRADRESGKLEFLDVAMINREKRVVHQIPKIRLQSFEEEKKAREAEAEASIARLVDEGLEEEKIELEGEGMSGKTSKTFTSDSADPILEVPSTPKSLFHSVGPTPTNSAPQSSEESTATESEDENLPTASERSSSVDTAERERREYLEELEEDPNFLGIGPAAPEYAASDPADRSDDTEDTLDWVYREHASRDPDHDPEGNSIPDNTPTASNDDDGTRTPTQETESASAASENVPSAFAPPSQELRALSVHDSEVGVTQSMMDEAEAVLNAQDKGKGRETDLGIGETMTLGSGARNNSEGEIASSYAGSNAPYASQDQQKAKGKQTIPNVFGDILMREHHGNKRGLGPNELDVAASLQTHSVVLIGETGPKPKQRNPPVPQPENMPKTLTEAICSYISLEANSILTLTLDRVDAPIPSPTDQRCTLLKHFEVGLDGVEGLCRGTARIPETPSVTAERERRVGQLGTLKQGSGGFYKTLKRTQQIEQQYGKGYWYFFGVKFRQTGKERKLRRGGKWLLFGAPIEAVTHLDIKRNQPDVGVMLGGGVDKSGTVCDPFRNNFKRTHTVFSRGGIVPMDIWPGGKDWEDGLFKEIKDAMANNGLRVGFLYADSEIFLPRPKGFPAAGKNQEEKKRKESEPDMTKEEMRAMEKSMKPKTLSAEAIGHILAMKVISDAAEQDAAGPSQ